MTLMSVGGAVDSADVTESGVSGPVDLARAARAAGAFLTTLGFDLDRPDTAMTPQRMARAWMELLTPPRFDPTRFATPPGCNGLVMVQGIPVAGLCEHHALPFRGTATIGYVPGDHIVGLSKLARAANAFAHGPQVQERLTAQIADWVAATLDPRAVGVHVRAEHWCMSARGACAADAWTDTTAYRGELVHDVVLRTEWLSLLRSGQRRA